VSDDWELLDGDPAAGDPSGIRLLAQEIGRTSDLAYGAQSDLNDIGADLTTCSWQGAAAAAFQVDFSELAPQLGTMAESYDAVARALRHYADSLEDLQAAAGQALTRARLARQRELAAGPRLDAAARRVADLGRQLRVVQVDERAKAAAAATAAFADPATATALQSAVQRARATRHAVEVALSSATTERNSAQVELDDARHQLGDARRWGDDIREDRRHAERVAAERIRGALDDSLRNRSNLERAASSVVHGLGNFGSHALGFLDAALVRHDFFGAVAELRQLLDYISPIITILTTIAVIAVGVFMVATGVAAPAGLVTIATATLTASKITAGLHWATTMILVVSKRPDAAGHDVGASDVAWDTVSMIAMSARTPTGGRPGGFRMPVGRPPANPRPVSYIVTQLRERPVRTMQRVIGAAFSNDDYAPAVRSLSNGRLRAGNLYRVWGEAPSGTRRALNEIAVGGSVIAERINTYEVGPGTYVRDRLATFDSGAATPAVGACYAQTTAP
jgi:WXG100 family type VII secretion target